MAQEKEIYTDVIMDILRNHQDLFLSHGKDASMFVNYNVLHMNEMGADPNVIRNITAAQLPLTPVLRPDAPSQYLLDSWTTEPFFSPKFEEDLLSYKKADSFIKQHVETLMAKVAHFCHWSIGAEVNTPKTPILLTSGSANAAGNNALLEKDVRDLAQAFDEALIPEANRFLMLTPNMYYELTGDGGDAIKLATLLGGQATDLTPKLTDVWGFKVYKRPGVTPMYNAALEKKPYMTSSAGVYNAAVAYVANHSFFIAKGGIEVNTEDRQVTYNSVLINAHIRASAQAYRQQSIGAIVQI